MHINDYKSELQEVIQKHRNVLPNYRLLEERGKPPNTQFKMGVFLDEIEIGKGVGGSKKEAEQNAAFNGLQNITNFIGYEKLSEVFFMKKEST